MSVNIEAVKNAIGIADFNRTDLLEIALTHPSHIYENQNLNRQQQVQQEREYRRLAILGDGIFNALVIDYLYHRFPNLNQGALTNNWKNSLLSRKKLSEFARKLNLRQLCLFGGSEIRKDESEQVELFGEMFEALLGAIYLEFERGFSRTRDWVEPFIKKAVDELSKDTKLTEEQLPEDYLQAVGVMNPDEAAELLWQMKEKADALVAEDEKLQQLLTWVNEKSLLVDSSYKPMKVRAFYLTLFRVLGLAFARNFDPTRGGASARQFALSFNRASRLALDIAFILNSQFDPANVLVSIFALDLEPELKHALQQLQAELPDPDKQRERFEEWRQTYGQTWVEKIRNILGDDLQFSKPQKKLLQQYYDENKLLMECLNKARDLAPEVVKNIEATLFLPKD